MAPSSPNVPPSPKPGRKSVVPTHRVTGDTLTAPLAGFVVVASIVAGRFLSRFQLDVLALLGLVALAPAADLVVSARTRAVAVTFGVCLSFVGIVGDGYWRGFGWFVPPVVLVALTTLIGFRALALRAGMVEWLNDRQQARDDAVIADLWPRIRTTWGLPAGTAFVGTRRTSTGWRMTFRTPGAATVIREHLATIAARIGASADDVTFTGDGTDHSYGHVHVRTSDPLAKPTMWTPPTGKNRIKDGVPFAIDSSGKVVRLPLMETHVRLSGSTRSGKSRGLEIIAAYVASCPDAALYICEVPKGGGDFRRWWPACLSIGTSHRASRKVLRQIRAVAEGRKQARIEKGLSGTWEPTAADPQLVVIIDEAQALFDKVRHKDIGETITRFAMELSGMGVTLVLGISNPVNDMMPTTARRQMLTRVSYKVGNHTASEIALDLPPDSKDRENTDASKLPFRTGHCIIATADMARPKRCRTYWAEPAALDAFAATVTPAAWVRPHPLLDPLDPDLRSDFHDEENDTADDVPAAAPDARRDLPPPSTAPLPPPVAAVHADTIPLLDSRPDRTTLGPHADRVWQIVADRSASGGRLSQADICRAANLSDKTVRVAVRALVAAGWLTETVEGRAKRYLPGAPR